MSAHVVSNATINAVVHLLDLDASCCGRGCLGVQYETLEGLKDQGDIWGAQLQALNIAAVDCRYAHRDEPSWAPRFTWSPAQYSLLTMVKAAECWSYQCSEGDKFTTSGIFQQVDKARWLAMNRIIHELPEYDSIKWDLAEDRRCVAG